MADNYLEYRQEEVNAAGRKEDNAKVKAEIAQ